MGESELSLRFRLKSWVEHNIVFLLVLVIATIIWSWVFSIASSDFLTGSSRPYRSVWNGSGQFSIFGLTLSYQFEGWADYDYYYQSWASQFLNGLMPYTDAFNAIYIDGESFTTPFFLPPLFLYLCSLGALMGPTGIGLLITVFGFVTAFPLYGIAEYLSENRRVGEIAVSTYLLNPLVLYYTAFQWLNPAPFVFFTVLSFYLLMKQRRIEGTLAMVTAVLFKQIAILFAIPLIAYLIKRPVSNNVHNREDITVNEKGNLQSDELDLAGFAKIAVLVIVYVLAWSFPYILDPGNYLYYILQRPGGTLLESVTELSEPTRPITITVILIQLGAPEWLAGFVNVANYYGILLYPWMITILVLCLIEEKDDSNLRGYWRRILFFTLLLIFAGHVFSPRGIYKYYCVALMPLISIMASSKMFSKESDRIGPTLSMILIPLVISIVILLPSRYVYISILLLVMISYILHKEFSLVYEMVSRPVRQLTTKLRESSHL